MGLQTFPGVRANRQAAATSAAPEEQLRRQHQPVRHSSPIDCSFERIRQAATAPLPQRKISLHAQHQAQGNTTSSFISSKKPHTAGTQKHLEDKDVVNRGMDRRRLMHLRGEGRVTRRGHSLHQEAPESPAMPAVKACGNNSTNRYCLSRLVCVKQQSPELSSPPSLFAASAQQQRDIERQQQQQQRD
ncbi:hypothetical protein Emag_003460 [Eimeria magna]